MVDNVKKPEQFGAGESGENSHEFVDKKPKLPSPSDFHVNIYSEKSNNGNQQDHGTVEPSNFSKEETANDGLKEIFSAVKSLDANRYATKKTIAQGMLDIALLTANASQLKYILQVGRQHEFYTLMLTLICLSIGLQAAVGILFIIVGGLDINRRRDQWAANIINDIILIGVFVISLTNVVISGFGMEFHNKPTELLAYRRHEIIQGIICLLLGSNYNINKEKDQKKADIWNNIALAMMILTVAANILISAFEMREINHMARSIDFPGSHPHGKR